jgi:tetratricopeptide (TPR) repeat protein
MRLERTDDELRERRAGVEISKQLLAQDPKNALFQRDHRLCLSRLTTALLAAGHAEEAIGPIDENIRQGEEAIAAQPQNLERKRDLSISYEQRAKALRLGKNWADAIRAAQAALNVRQELADLAIGDARRQHDLAGAYYTFAEIHHAAARDESRTVEQRRADLLECRDWLRKCSETSGAMIEQGTFPGGSAGVLEVLATEIAAREKELAALPTNAEERSDDNEEPSTSASANQE